MKRQRLCVLGASGSIGTNTLDVVSRHPERYEVFALTGHQRVDELLAQCLQWQPQFAAMSDLSAAKDLRARLREFGSRCEVLEGPAALVALAREVGREPSSPAETRAMLGVA